jgi:hypothetical protein
MASQIQRPDAHAASEPAINIAGVTSELGARLAL